MREHLQRSHEAGGRGAPFQDTWQEKGEKGQIEREIPHVSEGFSFVLWKMRKLGKHFDQRMACVVSIVQ